MKVFTLALISAILLTISYSFSQEQLPNNAVCTFRVDGVCEMCKLRIEKAALIKGVKLATWDKSTQQIKVYYKPKKVAEKQIHEAIAKVGHRTDQVEADKKAYHDLPDCCAYQGGITEH